ncbi:hypothetical protein HPP92_002298 [Vanilla planifolia]|uniref:Uncharacterized protein n=1 Tax=Vanilla planifolia TaxID=51239 RepID=A0A835S529_VANPL|nr:hypothetical protein HPP92_002298 [Vanilla planifolia]
MAEMRTAMLRRRTITHLKLNALRIPATKRLKVSVEAAAAVSVAGIPNRRSSSFPI